MLHASSSWLVFGVFVFGAGETVLQIPVVAFSSLSWGLILFSLGAVMGEVAGRGLALKSVVRWYARSPVGLPYGCGDLFKPLG